MARQSAIADDRVREDELLYVLTHLVTMSMWGANDPSDASDAPNGAATPLQAAAARSPRAHLFAYYPLLLQLAFVPSAPSMWVTPGEYLRLFGKDVDAGLDGGPGDSARPSMDANGEVGAGKGDDDMVEVSARELARRALELVGEELCLGS